MSKKGVSSNIPFSNTGLFPKEEMLEIGRKSSKLLIGMPKDKQNTESRVPLTPEAVELLVNQGHEIII
ncbi:MAG: hypothetical protein ACLFT4_10025 [Bacteroidales bacterium]